MWTTSSADGRRFMSLAIKHNSLPRLSIRSSGKDLRDRHQNNPRVESQRPVIDVLQIEAHPRFKVDLIPPPDRPETSQTRPHAQTPPLPALILGNLAWNRRAWSHKRHVALKYIDQLRNLVNGKPSQPFAHGRESWIVRNLCDHLFRVQMRYFMKPPFSIGNHGSELVKSKRSAIQSAARLPENNRSRRREFDGQCREQPDWTEERHAEHRQHDVDRPLRQQLNFVVGSCREGEQGRIADSFERRIAVHVRKKIDRDTGADSF